MKKVNSDLLNRGISAIYPSKEFLEEKLKKGEKITLYLGIDPTGPSLHLGHLIPIKKLAEFQKAGHQIIILFGDFTATIGDPSDKESTRQPLTRKQVLQNHKDYKEQISTILSFKGKNKAKIKYNSKWLRKLSFEKIISLASNMTVQQMIERDMFKKRIEGGKPIFMHEFFYPLMQAFDSVAMNVDGEIGGTDQTFNMLCGRDLMKTLSGKEKFVITTRLLEDNHGQKMGKTEKNMVSLSDNPEEMYGKIMSWTDGLIIPGFELCTNVPVDKIREFSEQLKDEKTNPRDLKMNLAKEIVSLVYGENKARNAEDNFINVFQNKEKPENIEIVNAKKDELLVNILLEKKLIKSKNEFRRLISSGSINIISPKEKQILSMEEKVENSVYRIGKKRFIEIKTRD